MPKLLPPSPLQAKYTLAHCEKLLAENEQACTVFYERIIAEKFHLEHPGSRPLRRRPAELKKVRREIVSVA